MTTYINTHIKSVRIFSKAGKINLDYYTLNGTRHRFSTGLSDTKQHRTAMERNKFNRAEEHYEQNRPSDAKTLFKDIAFEALRSTKDNRQEDTQSDYESLLERNILPILGKFSIGAIKPKDIEGWKAKLISKGISKTRFHKNWSTLRMIMQYCMKNEMIEKDPMQFVERNSKAFIQSVDRSKEYYIPSEVSSILTHSTGWFKSFMHLLFFTGIRTGEAMALQWEKINFEKREITISHSLRKGKLKATTKTGKTRVLNMSGALYNELKIHYENRLDDTFIYVSPSTGKTFYEPKSIVNTYLKPLLKKLDIEYKTIYATRHSFASNLVQNNAPMTYVQKMLGHKKLKTTMDFYVKNGLIDSKEMTPLLDNMYSA